LPNPLLILLIYHMPVSTLMLSASSTIPHLLFFLH
jgi:hypothetical protein